MIVVYFQICIYFMSPKVQVCVHVHQLDGSLSTNIWNWYSWPDLVSVEALPKGVDLSNLWDSMLRLHTSSSGKVVEVSIYNSLACSPTVWVSEWVSEGQSEGPFFDHALCPGIIFTYWRKDGATALLISKPLSWYMAVYTIVVHN